MIDTQPVSNPLEVNAHTCIKSVQDSLNAYTKFLTIPGSSVIATKGEMTHTIVKDTLAREATEKKLSQLSNADTS